MSLVVKPLGTTAGPFGFVDTPADNTSGVAGAVPFTGWALDDVEVLGVSVCRAAVPGEAAGADARCAGAAQIYVADAVFIDGARPDVDGAYPLLAAAQPRRVGRDGAYELPSEPGERDLPVLHVRPRRRGDDDRPGIADHDL